MLTAALSKFPAQRLATGNLTAPFPQYYLIATFDPDSQVHHGRNKFEASR
jgi:hypothetical protein